MGKEIEIKLAAADAAALERVRADARVDAARVGAWQEIRMVTEYLDTPDREIAARKWTLRRRTENGEAVYTTDAKIEVVPQAIRFFYPKGLTYHTKNSQSGHKFAEITP